MGYSKLFLFLSIYFYRFIVQVVADGLGGTVVTKLALRVGFLGVAAIMQTERERERDDREKQPPQQVRALRTVIFHRELTDSIYELGESR